jgi:predicted dehydrogenase
MKEERQVGYAVVGLGNIAQVAVLPAFEHAKENSKLVALVSSSDDKLRELQKKYDVSVGGSYDDFEQVLEEAEADAVYLALPNHMHRDFCERAARAGVHVLCEKPMALTEEDCTAMIDVTRGHDVRLMIAYRLHFEATNLAAIERVRRGDIGEPRIFSSVFSHQVRPGNIRTRRDAGGGALLDMGVYCVNAARYIFQDEPTEVMADQVFGEDERSREVDESTTAILRFPKNRTAIFTASQGAADVSQFRVVGTKGDIDLDPAYEYFGELEETVTVDGKSKTTTTGKRDQFAPELVHFSRCILEGTDPEPSGLQGLADVRIMQAIQRSARTGTRVSVAPVELDARPHQGLEQKKPAVGKIKPIGAPSPSQEE